MGGRLLCGDYPKRSNFHVYTTPWFSLEQEYTLLTLMASLLDGPKEGSLDPRDLTIVVLVSPGYKFLTGVTLIWCPCQLGTGKVFTHDLIEAHYCACLYAGIKPQGIFISHLPLSIHPSPSSSSTFIDEVAWWHQLCKVFLDWGTWPSPILQFTWASTPSEIAVHMVSNLTYLPCQSGVF